MFSNLFVRGVRFGKAVPSEDWLSKLPVVRQLAAMERLEFAAPVTFLVGENGVGKSTLIEAIAVAAGFNPEGGTVNFMFSTADSHSSLHEYVTLLRGVERPRDGFFLRAESFYNASTYISGDVNTLAGFGGVPLHEMSHGEGFMALFEHRFGGHSLYIFDEPEAALSPMRQMELMYHMDALVKEGAQFIIATHSPVLMTFPGAQLFELSKDGIVEKDYRDTEHFRVMRDFLNMPERMLRYLLRE